MVFEKFLSFVQTFHDQISELVHAIAIALHADSTSLRLPESVVQTFEKYVLALSYYTYALKHIRQHYSKAMQSRGKTASEHIRSLHRLHARLKNRSYEAFQACSLAQREMGLMLSALAQPTSISLRPVKPPFLVAHLMAGTRIRVSGPSQVQDVVQLCLQSISELVRAAHKSVNSANVIPSELKSKRGLGRGCSRTYTTSSGGSPRLRLPWFLRGLSLSTTLRSCDQALFGSQIKQEVATLFMKSDTCKSRYGCAATQSRHLRICCKTRKTLPEMSRGE